MGTIPAEKMRFRPLRTLELVLLVLVLWAACTFLLWRARGPCPEPMKPADCGELARIAKPLQPGLGRLDTPTPHHNTIHASPTHAFSNITPVYIVEEHHEVLKYWYNAADKGLIPKGGNVVLHIDGHSDGATPFEWKIIPLFRHPRTSEEITNMMQQNDVFMVAAAMTGLITRYIWVWPPWDTNDGEHPDQVDYQRMDVRAGTTYKHVNGNKVKELCACVSTGPIIKEKYCVMNNITEGSDDESGIPIEESACTFRTSGVIEIVSERKAILLMKSGKWLTHNDNVILDIDEDYYGCEAAVMPLYNSGLQETDIRDISMWIQLLVCAQGTADERTVDNFFHSVLESIIEFKHLCQSGVILRDRCNVSEARSAFWRQVPAMLKDLQGRIQGHFCKQNPGFILKMVLSKLVTFTADQLRALSQVGVCLSMSPKTLEFIPRDNMRLCDGYNRPNETMVVFHTPDVEEIDERTENMETILDGRMFSPKLVTICRSVRDGYTPKKYFRKIESDVLSVLQNSFSKVSENFILYDSDLLGGPTGWYGRH
ncbi:uncharacterized protein LOC124275093 [Haliotis rubra]|uniref:uncharacterized protein LOC124275093 n=1 Tax=Haliotis rubra TaxID=36100 RepID=UPI001EE54293|nr:uncharacterized protein LOC124275093 [Haliotis rubra]